MMTGCVDLCRGQHGGAMAGTEQLPAKPAVEAPMEEQLAQNSEAGQAPQATAEEPAAFFRACHSGTADFL